MVFEFSGRESELEVLNSAWDKALAGKTQWVSIISESGIGKTRLVHEFYNRFKLTSDNIFKDKSSHGYWPDKLTSQNYDLKLNPDIQLLNNDKVSSLKELPGMWWGVRCTSTGRRNSSNISSAIYDYLPQLLPHLAILKCISARQDNLQTVALDIGKKALSVATGGVVDLGILLYELGVNVHTLAKNSYNASSRDAYNAQNQELSESLIKAFSALSKSNVPTVLVLDDIQFIDSETLAFIDHIATKIGGGLLIITTCWSKEWHEHPLSKTVSEFPSDFHKIELQKTSKNHIDSIIRNEFPGLSEKDRSIISERSDTNLQYLYEICSLLKENPDDFFIEDDPNGKFHADVKEVLSSETFDIQNLIRRRYKSLPKQVQSILEDCSVQGIRFSSKLLSNQLIQEIHCDPSIQPSHLLDHATIPGYFLLQDSLYMYEFFQNGYWQLVQNKFERSNRREAILQHYIQQAEDIDTIEVDAQSKLILIAAVMPYISVEKQFKLSLDACYMLVQLRRYKDALQFYVNADLILRKSVGLETINLTKRISLELAKSLKEIIIHYPLLISKDQHIEASLLSNQNEKKLLGAIEEKFYPLKRQLWEINDTSSVENLHIKKLLSFTYQEARSTRQFGHTSLEIKALRDYLKVQKYLFDNHTQLVTIDMLFRYLLCLCRYIKVFSFYASSCEDWGEFYEYIASEDTYIHLAIKKGIFSQQKKLPFDSEMFLLNLSKASIQISILAWAQKGWGFFGKEIPRDDNYPGYCRAADFIADGYHDSDLLKSRSEFLQSLSGEHLSLLINMKDEIHLISALFNYPLAAVFSEQAFRHICKILGDESSMLSPEIIESASNLMLGVINNLEFGKARRSEALNQELKNIQLSSVKTVVLSDEEISTKEVLDIANKIRSYVMVIVDENRHTVELLVTLSRIELIIIDLKSSPTSSKNFEFFERIFHFAQLADDYDLLVNGDLAPFISLLKQQQSEFTSNSELYRQIDELGNEVYGKSWVKISTNVMN